jgi:squalene cyclase
MLDTNMELSLSSAIESAIHFLEVWQWPGGYWIDFELEIGMSSQWVTAYIAHCLARADASSRSLSPALDWLLRTQHKEGGWGYNRDIPPDGDVTANVLLFLAEYGRSILGEEELFRVADTLLTYRSALDGGFITYLSRTKKLGGGKPKFFFEGSGWCISHLSVTALAAVSLYAVNPTKYAVVLEAAAGYIRQRQNPAGYWDDYWWLDRIYGTYWASRFLHMLGYQTDTSHAVDWLVSINQGGNAWGNGLGDEVSPYHTAFAISTLMLLQDHPHLERLIQNGINWLLRNQRTDGSWISIPILLNPVPETHTPWQSTDASCCQAIADQYRLFTTATVLSALANFRISRSGHNKSSNPK